LEFNTNKHLTNIYDFTKDSNQILRRIKTPDLNSTECANIVRNEKIINILKLLIGDNIRFDGSKLNMKPPGNDGVVHWHQDWAFYPHTNDNLLTVGIMIDDHTIENGCMNVIPGSHQGIVYDHHHNEYFNGQIQISHLGDNIKKSIGLTGKKGDILIHHCKLVHSSNANITSQNRRFLLLQYKSADSYPLIPYNFNYKWWNSLLICGTEPTTISVKSDVIKLPIPQSKYQGSIFENQRKD